MNIKAIGLAIAGTLLMSAPAMAQGANWTGLYVGAHAGYAWGDVDVRDTNGGVLPGPFSYDAKGLFGGATAGYNWQLGKVVAGVEADLGYMDLSGSGIIPSSVPTAHQDITLDGGLYGDLTARLGFIPLERTMVYAKGGVAIYGGEARQKTTNPGYVTHGTDMFVGWVAGGGVEHFVTDKISIKAEYLHFDFGHQGGDQTSISDPPVGFVYRNATEVTADTIKVGVAFHF
jgi:outer membrane immunogenic protein